MIIYIISIVINIVIVYLLWNKKYVTHIHITNVFDHSGKQVAVLKEEFDRSLLNSDKNVQESDTTEAKSGHDPQTPFHDSSTIK